MTADPTAASSAAPVATRLSFADRFLLCPPRRARPSGWVSLY